MADRPDFRKRRAATPNRDEELDNTPKYADQATMAGRRVVRVRRTTPEDTVAPTLSGAFSGVSGISPAGAPALTTKFGPDGDKGDINATSDKAFSAPLFSFGEKLMGSTSFSFTTPPTGKASGRAPAFTFGVKGDNLNDTMMATTTTMTTSTTSIKGGDNHNTDKRDSTGDSSNSGGAPTTLFGGAFNFGGTVNSFLEAKERMAKAGSNTSERAPSPGLNNANDALANAAPVTTSSGEVLASVPAKLFVFKSETNSWADCGSGDAKVKRHEYQCSEGNEKKQQYLYRLIMRDGYALNAPLGSTLHLTKAEDTHIIFSLPLGDKITTYLLKYTGQQASTRGAEFTKTLKEALELAQKDLS